MRAASQISLQPSLKIIVFMQHLHLDFCRLLFYWYISKALHCLKSFFLRLIVQSFSESNKKVWKMLLNKLVVIKHKYLSMSSDSILLRRSYCVAMMTALYKDKYCISLTIYRTWIFFIMERRQQQRMRQNADEFFEDMVLINWKLLAPLNLEMTLKKKNQKEIMNLQLSLKNMQGLLTLWPTWSLNNNKLNWLKWGILSQLKHLWE